MRNQSETKTMIMTCRGIYRAITELDNVAAPRGENDLQREAHKYTGILQKALDESLKYWNDGSTDESENGPQLVQCAGNGSGKIQEWSTAATRENCDVYTVANESGLCDDCLAAALKYAGVSR